MAVETGREGTSEKPDATAESSKTASKEKSFNFKETIRTASARVGNALSKFKEWRQERRQIKLDKSYTEAQPEIQDAISEQLEELEELSGKSTEERAIFVDRYVASTREKYAEQLAARMDKTFTFKKGTRKRTSAAQKEYLIAVGLRARLEAQSLSGLEAQEAKLKFLLGDPADSTGKDFGERGLLEVETTRQRKLQSGFYEERTNDKGKTEVIRNEKGGIIEAFGQTWRKWSGEGWKGRAKKIAIGAAAGLLVGLTASSIGFVGGTAGALALGTSRVLRAAGTAKLEKTGKISAADSDTKVQLERLGQIRSNIVLGKTDLDRTLWDIQERADSLNKTHRRTTMAMGASALLAGTGGAEAIRGLVGSIFDTEDIKQSFGVGDGDTVHANQAPTSPHHEQSPSRPSETTHPTPSAPTEERSRPGVIKNQTPPPTGTATTGQPPVETGPAHVPGAGSEHVVTGTEMKGKLIEQVYRNEGLNPGEYVKHADLAMKDHELVKVGNPNGTFHYRIPKATMTKLGLHGDPTSTENVMKVLAKHSNGSIKIAA